MKPSRKKQISWSGTALRAWGVGYPASCHPEHCDLHRPHWAWLLPPGAQGNQLPLEMQGAAMETLVSYWTIPNWCSLCSQAVKVSCPRLSWPSSLCWAVPGHWDLWVLHRGVAVWGGGERATQYFLDGLIFSSIRGLKMYVHNQSSSQTELFFFYPMRKNVHLPLVGNSSKFHLRNIMELCFLASVDQERRKCSILSYKEHSPLYFFYYKSVLYCLGLIFLCYWGEGCSEQLLL